MSYRSPVIKMVLKLFTKYYLENNFFNRRIINSFTSFCFYIEAAKVQMKKVK